MDDASVPPGPPTGSRGSSEPLLENSSSGSSPRKALAQIGPPTGSHGSSEPIVEKNSSGSSPRKPFAQIGKRSFNKKDNNTPAVHDHKPGDVLLGTIQVPKSRVLLRGCQAQGLVSAMLGTFLGLSCISLFAPAMPLLRKKLDLDTHPISTAILVAIPVLSGSLLRVPFGAHSDTAGSFRPLICILMVCTFGMLCIAMVLKSVMGDNGEGTAPPGTYTLLCLFGAITGVGIGAFPVGLCQVSYWFSMEAQGTVLGVYGGVLSLPPGVAAYLLPVAFHHMGVPKAYFLWVGLLIMGTVTYYAIGLNAWYFQLLDMGFSREDSRMVAKEHGQELFPMGDTWEDLRTAVANWKTWALVALYSCAFGGQVAVIQWLPMYWHEQYALPPRQSGALTACFTVVVALSRGISGPLNNRLGGEVACVVFFAFTAVSALIVLVARWLPLSIFGVMLIALGLGICSNAVFKLVPQEVPEAVGGAAGIVSGLGCFGGFLQEPLMALFPKLLTWNKNSYALGFFVTVALASANVWVSIQLLRHSVHAQEPASALEARFLASFGRCKYVRADDLAETTVEDTNSNSEEGGYESDSATRSGAL